MFSIGIYQNRTIYIMLVLYQKLLTIYFRKGIRTIHIRFHFLRIQSLVRDFVQGIDMLILVDGISILA